MTLAGMPGFVQGLELNTHFYWEVVRPLVLRFVPESRHSAALTGYGSDVLGFDTPMSADHNWGPRLQLFLDATDYAGLSSDLDDHLRRNLPTSFMDYPTHFSAPNPDDGGTQHMELHAGGPVNHLIELCTVEDFTRSYLGIEPSQPLTAIDWLLLPEQKLLEFTSGRVFHDGLGTLGAARARFAYFPRQVWLVRLAAAWTQIAQEEAFLGRAGDLGDENGSWLVAARQVRRLIRLSLLYARRYAPYSKWLGMAFAKLPIAVDLSPCFVGLRSASDWRTREDWLTRALVRLAVEHNRLGATRWQAPNARYYFGRPFKVLDAGRFAKAIANQIRDPDLAWNAQNLGAVDQFTDSDTVGSSATIAARLRPIYEPI